METTTSVFDATVPVILQLRTPGGVKTVRVRFPSDDQWVERMRRQKVIIKDLGRGMSETVVPNGEEVDAALLTKIRVEEESPADVDSFEAAKCIDQLSTCIVEDVVPEGDAYRVTTRVLGCTTAHLLRMPSAKDVFEYRRTFARVLTMPFNKQELRFNLRAATDLYGKLAQGNEGYAGEVPIIHKFQAVKAAIDVLESGFQEERDESF